MSGTFFLTTAIEGDRMCTIKIHIQFTRRSANTQYKCAVDEVSNERTQHWWRCKDSNTKFIFENRQHIVLALLTGTPQAEHRLCCSQFVQRYENDLRASEQTNDREKENILFLFNFLFIFPTRCVRCGTASFHAHTLFYFIFFFTDSIYDVANIVWIYLDFDEIFVLCAYK